jgi:hypothetical protein
MTQFCVKKFVSISFDTKKLTQIIRIPRPECFEKKVNNDNHQ